MADLPGRNCPTTSGRSAARATTTSPGRRSGGRVYVHAGGSPQALATLRRRAAASTSTTPTSSATAGPSSGSRRAAAAAQPVHDRDQAARPRQASGRQGPGVRHGLEVRARRAARARPYGGTITVGYPYNTITVPATTGRTNTYLRSVTGESKQTDAANGTRIAPKNVIVMRMRFGPLNDGHPGKHRASRRPSSAAGRPGSRPTAGRSRAPGRRPRCTKPTRFYDADGKEVTLTIGQTFVQVVTTSTSSYPVSIKAGSDTPPATPVAERDARTS